MNISSRLKTIETTVLTLKNGPWTDFVIGAPHHALAGRKFLPCKGHRAADENTGFLAQYLAKQLNCSSIIACNSTIDPNKFLLSDYTKRITRLRPDVLVEIHGHKKVRSEYDVEISCGSRKLTRYSNLLARIISQKCKKDRTLSSISVCGHFDKIYYKAIGSCTITNSRWHAYHIELSPRLRKPKTVRVGRPPAEAYRFCKFIAEALTEMHIN